MVRELDKFCWTMLTVWAMSHQYFRADIEEWEDTTVVTVKTQAFDVETLEVRIIDKDIYINIFHDWFGLTIKIL